MRRALAMLLIGAATGGAGVVGARAADPGEERPRVYTNADLERFGPPDPRPEPSSRPDLGWDFVAAHLEREYARIDAERDLDLARRAADRADAVVAHDEERRRGRIWPFWGLPCPPGFWPGVPFGVPTIEPPEAGPRSTQGLRAFLSRRVTIHGQPRLRARVAGALPSDANAR